MRLFGLSECASISQTNIYLGTCDLENVKIEVRILKSEV